MKTLAARSLCAIRGDGRELGLSKTFEAHGMLWYTAIALNISELTKGTYGR